MISAPSEPRRIESDALPPPAPTVAAPRTPCCTALYDFDPGATFSLLRSELSFCLFHLLNYSCWYISWLTLPLPITDEVRKLI